MTSTVAPKSLRTATRRWMMTVVSLNVFAVVAAWMDQSWGAFGIAILWGPILNAILVLVPLLTEWQWRPRYQADLARPYVFAAILSPILLAIVDFLLISLVPLHGR